MLITTLLITLAVNVTKSSIIMYHCKRMAEEHVFHYVNFTLEHYLYHCVCLLKLHPCMINKIR